MKNVIFALAFSGLLLGCNKNMEVKNPKPAPTEIASDTVTPPKPQTSKNSLDYLGAYKGIVPDPDSEGIETSLELSEDFSYAMTQKYLGRSNKVLEQIGTFSWNAAGNAIILDNGKGNFDQYLVGENTLTPLGKSKKITEGKPALDYVLKKMTDSQAAKTDPEPQKELVADVTTIHWKLDALNGKDIKNEGEKDFYIELKKDNNFTAFAGCNRMAGHYEINGSKIKFLRVMATMMACANMTAEDQFKIALETADNFVVNAKILQLRKGGTTLAAFDAMPLKTKK